MNSEESMKLEALKVEVLELKREKAKVKTAVTKTKNRLVNLLQEDEVDKQTIKQIQGELDGRIEVSLQVLDTLCSTYRKLGDHESEERTIEEMEMIQTQLSDSNTQVLEFYNNLDKNKSSGTHSKQIGNDMWRQLKRVEIPIFTGDKKRYPAWKSAFTACVDKAPATAEYKLLQLKQYTSGAALKAIENLGHSAASYEAAKERLEQKFGGERRQVAIYLEDLDQFPAMKVESATQIEKFADILDVAVLNMKEANRDDDLKDGSLYLRLQRKMPETMLARFHRWIAENDETESVETLRDWVNQESRYHTIAHETISGLNAKTSQSNNSIQSSRKPVQRTFYSNKANSVAKCSQCGENHGIWNCPRFSALSINDRWNQAKQLNLCFRCLGSSHRAQSCKRTKKCEENGCQKTHHKLLHTEQLNVNATEYHPKNQPTSSLHTTSQSDQEAYNVTQSGYVALRTIPVNIKYQDREITITALLDDGSTKSFINEDVAAELGLTGEKEQVIVNVINGRTEIIDTMNVTFQIQSVDKLLTMDIEAQTTKNVTGKLKPTDWFKYSKDWPHLTNIKFHPLKRKHKVDLLIGLDYVELHQSMGEIHGEKGTPSARLTPLGWTCVGPTSHRKDQTTFFAFHAEARMEETVQKFWEIENEAIQVKENMSQKDRVVYEETEKSIRVENGHYEVEIPWKENKNSLPDNSEMAKKRLVSTEKRLEKDLVIKQMYSDTIDSYIKKGYITKCGTIEQNKIDTKWLLPHFPVIKLNRETTKVRIVFDASAAYQGISLNDTIEQGPILQNNLFDVLMRFRKEKVALVCDIQEMYLRVGIIPPDRKYHRILWRNSQDIEPEVYEFNRLVFGVNASPFLAQIIAQHNAKKYANEYPRASETVLLSTYMDDSMDSVDNEETCLNLYHDLTNLWGKADMLAHKWVSNSKYVMENIPIEDRALKVNLDISELPAIKTLGVLWLAESDNFVFQVKTVDSCIVSQMTKREYLRKIATLFDPLGFLAPYAIRAKVLMQDIWLSGIDWDDKITDDLLNKVETWFEELKTIEGIEVPRCIQSPSNTTKLTLHSFSDASESAYGASVYAKCEHEDNISSVRLIAAKSKVSPTTSTSIPRLELMAAVMSVKLTGTIVKALDLKMSDVTYWVDSLDVLHWIRNQSRIFKTFVANRVSTIQQSTNPSQWRHVPGKQNPADLISRGAKVSKLVEDRFWWQGPEFLKEDSSEWPITPMKTNKVELSEVKLNKGKQSHEPVLDCYYTDRNLETDWRLHPERFSSWKRLVHVNAWVKRFIDNCRSSVEDRKIGNLDLDEIRDSETQIIKDTQCKEFPEYRVLLNKGKLPTNSKLASLNPMIDNDNILRCDGRLKNAEYLSYDNRYPIILPRKCWVTRLIVRQHHEDGDHSGTNFTLSQLSSKYWVIHGREEIREAERSCMKCRRQKAKPAQQIMAPFPDIRVNLPMRAFGHIAVDYGGPFTTIQGRYKRREKRYLCLFTCLATRAVHLEMTYGLDTNSFLNAFFRMVNRRGMPVKVLSDNGTNFVAADKELRQLVTDIDTDEITKRTIDKGVTWQFNPPLAPHWGGVHEILIKSAKRALSGVLEKADITDEELLTAITGAEALLNSRPLTYQSANPQDDTPLTPNHFLIGQVGGVFAPQTLDTSDFNPRKRWRRVQELIRHFWNRWRKEWLPALSRRKKWHQQKRDLEVDDVVIVIYPDCARGDWPLGRVIETYPGSDKRVRAAKLLVKNKEIVRPITKLCPLELESDT